MVDFKYACILTGGIATGKSTVANALQKQGFDIIDMDKINHELLDFYSSDLAKIFGQKYLKDGKIDRKSLGNLIFSNSHAKERLEDFMHPLIKQEVFKKATRLEVFKKPYFIDNPLFFEMKSFYNIKNIILVYAPAKTQIQRLMKRNDLSLEEAQKRLDAQIDIEKKKTLASFMVDNSLDLEHLEKEVQRLNKRIKEKYAGSKI